MTTKMKSLQLLINDNNVCELHDPMTNTLPIRALQKYFSPGGGGGGGCTTSKIELGRDITDINLMYKFELFICNTFCVIVFTN